MNACNNTVNLITTHPFDGPFSGTTRVGQYQKGKTNLDFTEAKDIQWQWHQLGYVQVCTSLHTDNHASTPPLSFLQAGCPSCRPTNSVNNPNRRNSHVNRRHARVIVKFCVEHNITVTPYTSLCSASSLGCQYDTARICC